MTNFTFKKIDAPGPADTYAYISADGVDAAGEAVGNYGNVDGEGDGTFHGFTAQAGGSFTTFDPLGSTNTDVVGITPTGEIFGDYVDNANRQHGFVDNDGVVTPINFFLANSTTVNGVTDGGVIYGEFADNTNSVHGFIDNSGTFTQIDVPGASSTGVSGVNAAGVIVGTFTDAEFAVHGFIESNGSFKTIDPPGSTFTSVVGVSDAGVVVGNYQDSANNQHSFVDNNGVFTTINIPGATSTGISAINAAGEIVGYYVDGGGNIHGFIDENGVVTTVDVPGATQTDILGINAAGEISGYYNDSSGQHGFVGAPVPAVIESFGSTSLVQVGSNYFLDPVAGGTGPELKISGAPVVAGGSGDWTPIGAEQTASGYEIALKLAGANEYSVWATDSNGNYTSNLIGTALGTDPALESIETSFHQDLNGDGTIGLVANVIESFGSTSLVQVESNYFLDPVAGGTGPELKISGAAVVVGQSGGWTPIGAEQTSTGYEIAWKLAGANEYSVWATDSNGNYISNLIGNALGTDPALESIETSFHQDLNGDGTIGLVANVVESFGSTSLVQVGSNYFLDPVAGGTGPELKISGAAVVVGGSGGWTPIGAEQTSTGYEIALKLTGANEYSVWATDSNGNYTSNLIETALGTDPALESIETSFHQDLNGDGTIGLVANVVESFGSTSLVQVGNNYFLDPVAGGTGPELKISDAAVVVGQSGGWAPIGAEQTSTGYEIALKLTGTNEYSVWATDSNGNYTSNLIETALGTDPALESIETSFHQDLNGDGTIGLVANVVESFGSTSLVQVGSNYFLDPVAGGTGPELKISGAAVVVGQSGGWTPIGAEQTSTGYEIAFKLTGTNEYSVWATDSNGNYTSNLIETALGTDPALESIETSFHQDLNGDGTIGLVANVVESFGSTSLVQVGSNYFLDPVAGGTGPELKISGAAVVVGQSGGWTPISAEQTSTGYEIAWKLTGASEYSVWATDSNGNYTSNLIGTALGTDSALEVIETSFHQDLNGDGVIGIPITLIQTDGSTSLTQVGSNYFLYAVGGTSGPELYYSGAPVVAGAGQFSGWAPIGAVHTSSGYDVAWKMDGADQYAVWTTDNNGIFTGSTGPVAGASITLEAYEPTFQQDLNGDGTLGVVTTVIETAGSTTLEEVGNNFFLLSGGPIPTLKVDGTPYVVDERGSFTPIGAEEITTPVNDTYDVALKVAGADQYVVWSVDSDGNYISALTGTVSGNSATLESFEPIFQQDLNGDGSIGVVTTVIEAAGSTALTEVANNFYFYSGGVGPEFKFNGTPYVAGETADWTPIGAEQVLGGGYDVALKVAGVDQYTAWSTDSNGNYVSALFGTVSGSSTALESMESVFHQDLNGDGVIGTSAAIATAATLELTAADSVSVQFNGATGTLILDHSSAFAGQISGLTGTGSPSSSDQIDLKDIAFGTGTTVAYTGTSTGGMLTVSDAQNHTANIALMGDYTNSTFTLSSDGSGGTIVIDPPVKQDLVSGTLTFSAADSTDIHSVTVTPQNDGAGYIGNFTADAVTAANGQDSVGWHFNFDSSPPAKTVSQSYEVTVTDHHADGANSAATQPVTVTIAGPGNDAFVFHPGVGADVIVNAASSDTIELDGFSSVASNNQLASLLAEAQAGQPQSMFQSASGGHDTLINLGNHDSITLTNVHIADLHASNFIIH